LLALNRLWELNLSRARLREIGLQLGADVPFFIFGRNAVGESIGERLRALELQAAWYLVLTPQVSVSTKEMFDSALTADTKRLKIPPFFSDRGATISSRSSPLAIPKLRRSSRGSRADARGRA